MSSTGEFSKELLNLDIDMKADKVWKIGLMGPFGGNLGDAAIQQAMIQNINRFLPSSKVFGFSLDPKDTEARHGITSYPINRVSDREGWWLGKEPSSFTARLYNSFERLKSVSPPLFSKIARLLLGIPLEVFAILRAYKTIKTLDIFIVSGGGQLDDYWYGPWFHPYTLLVWAVLAKLAGVKFLIVSVGAGPLSARISRLFIRITLALADYCSYRDQDSKRYIESFLGKANKDAFVFPDLAHSLEIPANQALITSSCRRLIGIGPIPYFNPELWPEKDGIIYWNYLEKLAEFINWLFKKEYGILFLIGEFGQDKPAINDLKSILYRNSEKHFHDRIIDQPILSVDTLLNCIDKTEMVISSRFHGVLLSQVMRTPVLALSYHPKINVLMASSGCQEYCLPIDNFTVKDLQRKFIALEENDFQVEQQLLQFTQDCKNALREQYKNIFGS